MSYIDHRCSACGHTGINHNPNGGCWCGCQATRTTGPTELVATYTLDRVLIEAITPPGDRVLSSTACICQDCVDMHTRLTQPAAN